MGHRKLDDHKRFGKLSNINGLEPLGDLVEWFETLTVSINGILPESTEILADLPTRPEDVNANYISTLPVGAATMLNSELDSLLATFYVGKAWPLLKSINCDNGLEALRFRSIALQ